jgi:hypothetical protein
MTSAALRMRRFRKQKPELAKAIDKRRTDARRREEEAARAYVASYLRRGRIVPPAACDECGDLSDRLRPWHPDPSEKKKVAWLCPQHRRSVPAMEQPVILHWEWPGINVPPTRPRWLRFVIDPEHVAAGLSAVRRAEIRGAIRTPGDRSRVFVEGFLSAAGPTITQALIAHGIRSKNTWSPYGDEIIDAHLRDWLERERRRRDRERRLVPTVEVAEVEPAFGPRVRRARHDRPVRTIPPPQRPREIRVPLDLDALDALIAKTNAIVDETMARVKSNLQSK